jgi:tetratricopeptide (TPR) repeat protein
MIKSSRNLSKWARKDPSNLYSAAMALTSGSEADPTKAKLLFDALLEVMPEHPQILKAAAINLFAMADYRKSERLFNRLLKTDPMDCAASLNRGLARYLRGGIDQGVQDFERSLIMSPSYLEGWINLGCHLKDSLQIDKARQRLSRALAIYPENPRVLYSLAHIELIAGNYPEGWRLYESGLLSGDRRQVSKQANKIWDGVESLSGKTILLRMEQGLGDTIQNLRFVEPLQKRGARVIAELPRSLKGLFPNLECIDLNQVCKGLDYECHIMSLSHLLGVDIGSIPAAGGYLQADASKASEWRARLDTDRMNIGVVWSGSKKHLNDQFRSIPLDVFVALYKLNADFHVLKNELANDEKRLLSRYRNVRCYDADLKDFSDTAALIHCLDMVITVDTSVAHLSGALGKKTYILLSNRPDYRWMADRVDSPWYQSVTLVRQGVGEEWAELLIRLKSLLCLHQSVDLFLD